MSPVERIQAATEKLEYLQATSTRGQWVMSNGGVMFAGTFGLSPVLSTHTGARKDAELIVTLHRTIDAQLVILNSAALRIVTPTGGQITYSSGPGSFVDHALALADAILGEDT